jgi:DNA polymerase-3 subunit delta'
LSGTGEDRIFARIRAAADAGTLSHAFIISGEGDRLAAAKYLAAAMECTAEKGRPCGKCDACRKVAESIHPDVSVVADDEHKTISVEVMRSVRSDAYILPNEGKRRVYIFPDCEKTDQRGQDVMLKTVEEGPERAAFIFCAESASSLLATIRSRCIELRLAEGAEAEENPMLGPALEMCDYISRRNETALAGFLAQLESKRTDRASLSPLFGAAREVCAAALLSLYGRDTPENYEDMPRKLAKSLTKAQLAGIIDILEKYRDESEYNVGVGHTLGAFGAEAASVFGRT